MAELRRAFSREHGLQCGYCTPGMLVTARDIVLRLGDPGEERTRAELAGNLCRCTGYVGIVKAIRSVGATSPVEARPSPRPPDGPACAVAAPPGPPVPAPQGGGPARPAAAIPGKAIPGKAAAGADGPSVTQTAVIRAGLDDVWALLRDLNRVAGCVPGAQLTAFDDTTFEGQVAVALGPIRARIGGRGTYAFDDAARSGAISGSGPGQDHEVQGHGRPELRAPKPRRDLDRAIRHPGVRHPGPLAQFSRSSIVREFTMRLMDEFAARAGALITGGAAAVPETRPLGAVAAARWMIAALWHAIVRRR